MSIVTAKKAYTTSEVLTLKAIKGKTNTNYEKVASSVDGDMVFISEEGREYLKNFPVKLASIKKKIMAFDLFQSLKTPTNFRERVINTYLKMQYLI